MTNTEFLKHTAPLVAFWALYFALGSFWYALLLALLLRLVWFGLCPVLRVLGRPVFGNCSTMH